MAFNIEKPDFAFRIAAKNKSPVLDVSAVCRRQRRFFID